jgi:hypothetical protein
MLGHRLRRAVSQLLPKSQPLCQFASRRLSSALHKSDSHLHLSGAIQKCFHLASPAPQPHRASLAQWTSENYRTRLAQMRPQESEPCACTGVYACISACVHDSLCVKKKEQPKERNLHCDSPSEVGSQGAPDPCASGSAGTPSIDGLVEEAVTKCNRSALFTPSAVR